MPGGPLLHQLIKHDNRWGWVVRHPIATIFSIVVFVVIFLIVVMILTLNGDVQALYAQNPYNETGVSAFQVCDARDRCETLLTRRVLVRLR